MFIGATVPWGAESEEPVPNAAEGTPRVPILPMLLVPFQPPKPAPGGSATAFPWRR
jgi:hypothetical protein